MDYMTLKEASEKWGVSIRQINYYSPHRIRIERYPDRAEKIPARSGRKIGIVPEERPPRKRQLSEQARRFGGMGRTYSALRL